MKKLTGFIVVAILVFAGCQKSGLETTTIKANSMVCGSCAKTVKEAVYAVEGVKNVDVDLDKKIVEVKYVPAQTNLATLERAITDAGYDANDKKRDPGAYDKLEACCKIDK
ncbi:MAG TPA: heavy-metal-associated domain-containing protein [Bacteroidota bacterium]|jgi:copper chaperone CopZ|nr:heavy-metal-associated domain-containing protein [Bacteroidota bacterium]